MGTGGHHQLQVGDGQTLPSKPRASPCLGTPSVASFVYERTRRGGLTRGSEVSLQMWVLSARHCLVPPPARAACPAALLPLCPATRWWARQLQPMGDSAGRLQQQEGSCITIRYNLSPFLLPSSAGDGYCLIPFDSSFIICLPPSSFPWLLQGSFVAVIKAW